MFKTHSSTIKGVLALTLACGSLSAWSVPNSKDMEAFLRGFESACSHSKAYERLQASACKPAKAKSGFMGCSAGKLALPESLAGLLMDPKAEDRGDFTQLSARFAPGTTWRGLSLSGWESWSGHENGIFGSALVLEKALSPAQAKSIAQKAGAKFTVAKSDAVGEHGAVFAKGDDGRLRLVCDLSD